MNFNKHFDLQGLHAFLSASNYHWINYEPEKLEEVYRNRMATLRGTELHDLASNLIRLKQRLPDTTQTLNAYVNDAIGFRMMPEQILYYSPNCFGTADAISFYDNFLRIHDLKTGTTKTSVHQLEVYAALFCLEYGLRPGEIDMELRLYQNDEVQIFEADLVQIVQIMNKIKDFDERINAVRMEAA